MSRAPLGRRSCPVAASRRTGGYQLVELVDRDGPVPAAGQFYMLATRSAWGEGDGRPLLPRALSVAEATGLSPKEGGAGRERGARLSFLLEAIGPGTERLCAVSEGEEIWVAGPFGNGFSEPGKLAEGRAGAILVGGGVGVAPLAIWRRRLLERNWPVRVLLGFRDEQHQGGIDELFPCCEVGLASETGRLGGQTGAIHPGRVTELLERLLAGDAAGSAAVYACGPPPMLDAVRNLCRPADVPCELALEAPMACGFGACHGCAVAGADGSFLRLCVEGPVLRAERLAPGPAGVGGH